MGSGISSNFRKSRRSRATVAVVDLPQEDPSSDDPVFRPTASNFDSNPSNVTGSAEPLQQRLTEEEEGNDDVCVPSAEEQPSPDARSRGSAGLESNSDMVYSAEEREEMMMMMLLQSAHSEKQNKNRNATAEPDDENNGVEDGYDANEGAFAAETAEMFAHTAMSLEMDDRDLLFNLMYFNEGGLGVFAGDGGEVRDGNGPPVPSFGSILNSVQQEAVALYSENNTPYKLKPASEDAIAGLQRGIFSLHHIMQKQPTSCKHQHDDINKKSPYGETMNMTADVSVASSWDVDVNTDSGGDRSNNVGNIDGAKHECIQQDAPSDVVTECAVCMEELEEGCDILRIPVCEHYFHEECLLRWIKLQSWCPVCRVPIASSNTLDSSADAKEAGSTAALVYGGAGNTSAPIEHFSPDGAAMAATAASAKDAPSSAGVDAYGAKDTKQAIDAFDNVDISARVYNRGPSRRLFLEDDVEQRRAVAAGQQP